MAVIMACKIVFSQVRALYTNMLMFLTQVYVTLIRGAWWHIKIIHA